MSIEADLQQFIASETVLEDPGAGIGLDDPLISSGKVDSMGLLQILGHIQQRYGVDLLATASPNDFETVQSLAAAIRRAGVNG
jgi:acyl carrier protein